MNAQPDLLCPWSAAARSPLSEPDDNEHDVGFGGPIAGLLAPDHHAFLLDPAAPPPHPQQQRPRDADPDFKHMDFLPNGMQFPEPPHFHNPAQPLYDSQNKPPSVKAEPGLNTGTMSSSNPTPTRVPDLNPFGNESADDEFSLDIHHDLMFRRIIQDIVTTCTNLCLPTDPSQWTVEHCNAWIAEMCQQFQLPHAGPLQISGKDLMRMSADQLNRLIPHGGDQIHAQFHVWRIAFDSYPAAPAPHAARRPPPFHAAPCSSASSSSSSSSSTSSSQWDSTSESGEPKEFGRRAAFPPPYFADAEPFKSSRASTASSGPPSAPYYGQASPAAEPGLVLSPCHSLSSGSSCNEDDFADFAYPPPPPHHIAPPPHHHHQHQQQQQQQQHYAQLHQKAPHHPAHLLYQQQQQQPPQQQQQPCYFYAQPHPLPQPNVHFAQPKQPPAVQEPDYANGAVSTGGRTVHLWHFIKELLENPQKYSQCVRWVDRNEGTFKIESSQHLARIWGIRKNRSQMNYDKLSRSLRQYYKKGIIQKPEKKQRLVYKFLPPYSYWRPTLSEH